MQRMQLSAMSYDRILKVAHSIIDFFGVVTIETPHLAEAFQYGGLDQPLPV